MRQGDEGNHDEQRADDERLRLISPADDDIDRYLDEVKTIALRTPKVDFKGLPVQQKGARCSSDALVRCADAKCRPATLDGVE
jgi:hypothetical protein